MGVKNLFMRFLGSVLMGEKRTHKQYLPPKIPRAHFVSMFFFRLLFLLPSLGGGGLGIRNRWLIIAMP